MYTIAPIPPINTIDDHGGFYILLFLGIMLVWAAWEVENGWLLLAGIILPCFAGYVSWTTGRYYEYPNEKVTGEFVRYVAEGYSETVRSGKSTRQVDRHVVYVAYKINGNEVLFNAQTGVEYPKFATFYKN